MKFNSPPYQYKAVTFVLDNCNFKLAVKCHRPGRHGAYLPTITFAVSESRMNYHKYPKNTPIRVKKASKQDTPRFLHDDESQHILNPYELKIITHILQKETRRQTANTKPVKINIPVRILTF